MARDCPWVVSQGRSQAERPHTGLRPTDLGSAPGSFSILPPPDPGRQSAPPPEPPPKPPRLSSAPPRSGHGRPRSPVENTSPQFDSLDVSGGGVAWRSERRTLSQVARGVNHGGDAVDGLLNACRIRCSLGNVTERIVWRINRYTPFTLYPIYCKSGVCR